MLLDDAARIAEDLIALHLPRGGWGFAFDGAKRRAGACDWSKRRITISRHLVEGGRAPGAAGADAAGADAAEVRQVVLHEIAHALAGHRAAHGPRWKAAAARIGYTGSRLHDRPIAEDRATWLGVCPAGHEHRRFRRPAAQLSCGRCSRRFSSAALITWRRADALRGPSAADGAVRTAPSAAGSPRSG